MSMLGSFYWSWSGQRCVGVRCRTAGGDKTRLSFEKYGRKYILELWCETSLMTEWWSYDTSECQGNSKKYLLELARAVAV